MKKHIKAKLLLGESIDFSKPAKRTIENDDEAINEKYIRGEVRIVTEQARYPLDSIKTMIDSKKYRLNPDYQRRRRWDNEKKSKLIESFIMNVPIPPVFLYENELSYYEVMDGQQRLSTIYDFYNDDITLSGLELWPELNRRKYSTLPERIKQGIDRRYLSSIILLKESARSSEDAQNMKQLVFERINSGGVSLTPQETRNALYDGAMNRLCLKLSESESLRKLIGLPTKRKFDVDDEQLLFDPNDALANHLPNRLEDNETYKKMEDVEYVLRFFAMRQVEGYTNLKLYEFLDFYLQKANQFSTELLDDMATLFTNTITFADELLGKESFYLWRNRTTAKKEFWYWFSRPTTTVYDPLMYVLSMLLPERDALIFRKEKVREELKIFYVENYSSFEGRSSNKNDIIRRRELYFSFFENLIGEQ